MTVERLEEYEELATCCQGQSPDGSEPCPELTEACQEIRRLKAELEDERRFCICGCAMDEHENYGEDGFACDNQCHECVLVCAAAANIASGLMAEVERWKQKFDEADKAFKLRDRNFDELFEDFKAHEEVMRVALAWIEAPDTNKPVLKTKVTDALRARLEEK